MLTRSSTTNREENMKDIARQTITSFMCENNTAQRKLRKAKNTINKLLGIIKEDL